MLALPGVLKKWPGSSPWKLPGSRKIQVALSVEHQTPHDLFSSKFSWQIPWAQKQTRVSTRVLTKLICAQMPLAAPSSYAHASIAS